MLEEPRALMEKGVYERVARPTHKRTLPVKWVFNVKRDATGAIEEYKARLVAKAILQ